VNRLSKVVVVGASGQLGADIVTVLRDGFDVAGVDHAQVDIERPSAVAAMLVRFTPDLVINTAAYHNVERCETHAERAFAVNGVAVDSLALACALAGSALLHVSTDYVFDGDAQRPYGEADRTRPRNVYGVSKLAGELLAANRLERLWIVRTSGLYGSRGSSTKGYTFIERIIAQARRNETVRVVDDVTFSPSYTVHVARAIRNIVTAAPFGTYHVTNAGSCTWHAFAAEVFAQLGLDPKFEATSSDAFPTYARRPRFSALAHDAMEGAGLPAVPSWQDGIRAYLTSKSRGNPSGFGFTGEGRSP